MPFLGKTNLYRIYMRKNHSVMMTLLCSMLFCALNIFAHADNSSIRENGKVYVHPNQLAIVKEGIFVNLNNTWFMANALNCDNGGLYVSELMGDDWSINWICPKCEKVNGPFAKVCGRCGYTVL